MKIQVPDPRKIMLRIVSTVSDGHSSLFFDSALKAFEDSGADTAKIERIYEETYNQLSEVTSASLGILQQIYRVPDDERETGMKTRYSLLKLALRLEHDGIHSEDYQYSFLDLYLRRLAKRARDKDLFQIPIPGSYCVLGLTDDYEVLEPNGLNELSEVFIRAKGQTISGTVLIYRDPIIHIGDIQKAEAVSEDILRARMTKYIDAEDRMNALISMDNVIFFSQNDDPPLPNRLSGGDLDGDRFEIVTKDCGFWGDEYKTSDPDSYTDDGIKSTGKKVSDNEIKSFDVKELANFIGSYIRNDCFLELQDTLMSLADQESEGLKSDRVRGLAKWLSQAVDYAKSGQEVNLARDIFTNPNFNVTTKPDFLYPLSQKAFHDVNGEYYQTPNLLGRIYRKVADTEYTIPNVVTNLGLRKKLADVWRLEGLIENTTSLAEDVDELDDAARAIANDGALDFMDFMLWLDTPVSVLSSEIDLFLGKQRADILNTQIDDLVDKILSELAQRDIVVIVDASPTPRLVRLGGRYDHETVEMIYKRCLYVAW